MIEICRVKVRGSGFNEMYLTQRIPLQIGDSCLVESDIGIQVAQVVSGPILMKARILTEQLPKVIRKASEVDMQNLELLIAREEEAFSYCEERISSRELDMKLIRVLFAFDQSKALFMFTADGRIDFRELVRDLAHRYKTRIEMKQIGVRDEARLLGGIGICGHTLCCVRFLRDFHPVSIKMAKDQGLSLIPSKISGVCGRLMCCLQYEHNFYSEQIKCMPRIGKRVITPAGEGRVRQINMLRGKIHVEVDGEVHEFGYEEVSKIPHPGRSEQSSAAETDNSTGDPDSAQETQESPEDLDSAPESHESSEV